jgi:hypothetical protein
MTETIIRRFNSIKWHDSKLLGVSFYRAGSEELVKISLELIEAGRVPEPCQMIFVASTYIQLDVDLDAKRVCADDISSAECHASSEWVRKLTEGNPHDTFEGYLHFEIGMIPPGGTINILAKDFVIEH